MTASLVYWETFASPAMPQMRPLWLPPLSQASEADSCFMGRPFSHSRLGSQPGVKQGSACLSNTARHSPCLPCHLLPHLHSEVSSASRLLTRAAEFTRQLCPAQQGRGPPRLGCTESESTRQIRMQVSTLKNMSQGFGAATQAGKVKTGLESSPTQS